MEVTLLNVRITFQKNEVVTDAIQPVFFREPVPSLLYRGGHQTFFSDAPYIPHKATGDT